jgi:murein DD-endopeptidase MepM/ murein hydrolase activator NlpD
LNSESIDQVESARAYAHVALEDQNLLIFGIEDLEARVDELVIRNEGLERVAKKAHRRVAKFETRVQKRRDALDTLRESAVDDKAELQTQLADIQTRRTEYEQRLNALEQDSDSASVALQRAQAGQLSGPPPRLHSPLLEPSIGSVFGPRLHPIFGNVRMHNGLDYGGSSGDEIYAAAAGVVVMAEARGGYGNVVVIDHGGQWGTLYAHQSRLLVVPGQQVARGEVVGWVGSTGYSTGPHLHFELRQFGDPRDPFNNIDFEELHPVECEVLIRSEHPNDLAAAQRRDDCAELFEVDEPEAGDGEGQ